MNAEGTSRSDSPLFAYREPYKHLQQIYRYLPTKYVESFLAGDIWISTLECCRRGLGAKGHGADSGDGVETIHRTFYDPDTATEADKLAMRRNFSGIVEGDPAEARFENVFSIPAPVDGYVFCTSMAGKDPGLYEKFGPKCIRIAQPHLAGRLIREALRACREIEDFKARPVVYRGRSLVDNEGADTPPGFHSIYRNRDEKEWRMIGYTPAGHIPQPFVLHVPELKRLVSKA